MPKAEELTKIGDERITRESERRFEYLTEAKNRMNKKRGYEGTATGVGGSGSVV